MNLFLKVSGLLLIFACSIGQQAYAQNVFSNQLPNTNSVTTTTTTTTTTQPGKQNNVWVIGYNLGLDFKTDPPTAFSTGPVNPFGGMGSVADVNGNLLFYTNSDTIWNRNFQVMPNSIRVGQNYTGDKECVIVPVVNDPDKYYVFTESGLNNDTLRYSIVDMTLAGGLGDVPPGQKAITLAIGISTGLAVVKGAGAGCYLWLVAHSNSSDTFMAYRIDANGINTVPVLSRSGAFDPPIPSVVAEIAASPDGKHIALCNQEVNFVELHSFDAATGAVTDPILLADYRSLNTYRSPTVCFAPGSSKLYMTTASVIQTLEQYDLTTLPVITNTVILDSGTFDHFSGFMRLGPDGKIYCGANDRGGMSAILQPDAAGQACGFTNYYVPLPPGATVAALPLGTNVVTPMFYITHLTDTVICNDEPAALHSYAASGPYLWSDGDTTATKAIDRSGALWVRSSADCQVQTDTFDVQASPCDCDVAIPTAFTPNNDGHDDAFNIIGTDIVVQELNIYNRYGQQVYSSAGPKQSWNGTHDGRPCDIGTYFYYARIKCIKGQMLTRKGEVTLVR